MDLSPPSLIIAALLLLASCLRTTGIPVPYILLVAMASSIEGKKEKGGMAAAIQMIFMVLWMVSFISGQRVGNLIICKNGGWTQRPNVYCIIVGRKQLKYKIPFSTCRVKNTNKAHIIRTLKSIRQTYHVLIMRIIW